MSGFAKHARLSIAAGLIGLAVPLALAPAQAQGAAAVASWLDPTLLAAAKGRHADRLFVDQRAGRPAAVQDLHGRDRHQGRTMSAPPTRVLMSRIAIEFRAEQKSWDILHTGTINKMPPQMLAQFEPPEAKHIFPEARDPGPALVRRLRQLQRARLQHQDGEGVRAAEELRGVRRAQAMGRQGRDRRHRQRMAQGDVRALRRAEGERRSSRTSSATLKPVITDGHLALARATGAGEYWISLNNYVNLSMNVKLAGGPIDVWALDPVALFFGQVGVNAQGAAIRTRRGSPPISCSARSAQQFLAKFGRLPTRSDVHDNPPGIVDDAHAEEGHPGAADAGGRKGLAAAVRRAVQGR